MEIYGSLQRHHSVYIRHHPTTSNSSSYYYAVQRNKAEWVWNYLNDYHQGYENVYDSKSTSHVSFLIPNSRFHCIITQFQVWGNCTNCSLWPDIIEETLNIIKYNSLYSLNKYILNRETILSRSLRKQNESCDSRVQRINWLWIKIVTNGQLSEWVSYLYYPGCKTR